MPKTTRADVEEYLSSKGWAWKERAGQLIMACPYCGSDNHFYVNAETGLNDCKKCGRAGNLYQLRQEMGDRLAVEHLQHASQLSPRVPLSRPAADLPTKDEWAKAEAALWSSEPDGFAARHHLLGERKLTEEIVRGAHIGLLARWGKSWIGIPYLRHGGEVASLKLRSIPPAAKAFARVEGAPSLLFGGEKLKGKTEVVLTEGELDVLAMRVYGVKACASTSLGARGWAKEWNSAFEGATAILLAYDQDEEGDAGALAVSQILGTSRCLRVRLPRKDACDCLRDGIDAGVIQACLRDAEQLSGPRVRPLSDFGSDAMHDAEAGRGDATPWVSLTNLVGGIRRGDEIVVTGKTGAGKSTLLVNLGFRRSESGSPVLFFPAEQRPADVFRKVAATILGCSWFEVDDCRRNDAFVRIASLPFYIIAHYGRVQPEELHDAIRYAVTRLCVRDVMLDHLHFFWPVRNGEHERADIGDAVRALKTWAQELGITIWLVVQPGKTKGPVGIDDLRGSAELQQTPDMVIVVRRDRAASRDTTKLAIEKCRHEAGREGIISLSFDRAAQDYSEIVPRSAFDAPEAEDEPPGSVQ